MKTSLGTAKGPYHFPLLQALPKPKRNVTGRAEAKTPEVIAISKQYGEMYFDGPRTYGYGGYRYDGRWIPVAKDMIEHFGLKSGDSFLDVGCAKGFLAQDLERVCPGLTAFGMDISEYAIKQANPIIRPHLIVADARELPFKTASCKAVVSLNTIHNLPRPDVIQALKEIQRVSQGCAFVQVDSYLTPEQKDIFESWVLTAEFHDYPKGWLEVFHEAGYTGAYDWTLI